MIELAILGLLEEQDLHGYELKKRLAELLGLAVGRLVRLAVPGAGPARERRARSRRVEAHTAPTPPIPMTGVAQRRAGRLPGPPPAATGRTGRRAARRSTASPSVGRDRLARAARRRPGRRRPRLRRCRSPSAATCRPTQRLGAVRAPPGRARRQLAGGAGRRGSADGRDRPLPPLAARARHQTIDARPRLARRADRRSRSAEHRRRPSRTHLTGGHHP